MITIALPRDPEATRRKVGLVLYAIGMVGGAALIFLMLRHTLLRPDRRDLELSAMAYGALFALPMLLVYLWLPWVVDRYDPEPAWALLLTLGWGSVAAIGLAGTVNTAIEHYGTAIGGEELGQILGACVSAPLFEELSKGIAVFFMFYFFRREFDGVVDGVIYATFAALGFAAVENILYYGSAAKTDILGNQDTMLVATFFVRGVLAPWGHPLYTSMTGIGFGIARETNSRALRWLAPIVGYFFAAFLHSVWNTSALVSGWLTVLMLPLWFLFVTAFAGMVIYLVVRKGRIIHDYLQDEVMMGIMTAWEVDLVSSPVASMRATFSFGGASGRRFVSAASRLALSKWHTGRAMRASNRTISADMILPLRKELRRLRGEIARHLGRPIPEPQAVVPGSAAVSK